MKVLLLVIVIAAATVSKKHEKRALQKSREKPQADKWMDRFMGVKTSFDQISSLVELLDYVTEMYLKDCTPVILYDSAVEHSDSLLLEQLFRNYPIAYMHGQITRKYKIHTKQLLKPFDNKCVSYLLFMADVMRCKEVIGPKSADKVVVIARSSQWRVYEFLSSEIAQSFVNLLVIAQSEKAGNLLIERPFILYTHKLYVDGLGSSIPQVLTSWVRGSLTRPQVPLFPQKMKEGFAGHRFIVALANQPPFVIRRSRDANDDLTWEGSEIRLVKFLSMMYNFTTDFREAKLIDSLGLYKGHAVNYTETKDTWDPNGHDTHNTCFKHELKRHRSINPSHENDLSSGAVTTEVRSGRANIGLGGIFLTSDTYGIVDSSLGHSQDCAAFISVTSTALPRWRAILGPFHWTVWIVLTLAYLVAILPLAFSYSHSFRILIDKPQEIENMFWYVFGTFTNCFTFSGEQSWTQGDKAATRVLIGFYWMFTIIITACYTGSIIAFVTLPVFPETVDTVKQLLNGRYQIGTLDKGGWTHWFENTSDPNTEKLLKHIEYVPSVEAGIKNTTRAFFWSYAFLGSREELDYIVHTNYSTEKKRSMLHVSSECFVPYGISMMFTLDAIYATTLNQGVQIAVQNGFMIKFTNDVKWEMMRSSAGKRLAANSDGKLKALASEDRALALQDTQGMFLLLAFGFTLGGCALISEWLGGCFNYCRGRGRRRGSACSIASNRRSLDVPTPRQKLDSIQYSSGKHMLGYILDADNEEARDDNEVYDNHVNEADIANNREDIEVEINNMYNFDYLLGEENAQPVNNEELIDSDRS